MATRLSTGLAGLDAQIGGGVPPGTVHVLIGEPMNALELFTYHFAAGDGKQGTMFVSTEATESEIQGGVKAVGGRPERVKPVLVPEGTEVPDMPRGARYVLDSFSALSTRVPFDEAFGVLDQLKQQARASGGAALVTAIHGLHDERERSRLRLWADGALELGFDRQGFGLYPFLKVTKMRGVPDSARFLLFKETAKGLFMESTRRVF